MARSLKMDDERREFVRKIQRMVASDTAPCMDSYAGWHEINDKYGKAVADDALPGVSEEMEREKKWAKLREIVFNNPGLDAIALKGKGWRPQIHGSLREAGKLGIVKFRNGDNGHGWYPN